MEFFLLLTRFYNKVHADNRISVTHISLYVALLHEMVCSGGIDLLLLRPEMIMDKSKISSRVTYHRCMRALHEYGYISYEPSFRPGESKVRLIELL